MAYVSRADLQSVFGTSMETVYSLYDVTGTATRYIMAPVFRLRMHVYAEGISVASGSWSVYRYDGSGWTLVDSHSMQTAIGSNDLTWTFGHNYSGSVNTRESSNRHVFKVTVSFSAGPIMAWCDTEFEAIAGGVACSQNSNQNTYKAGVHIRRSLIKSYGLGARDLDIGVAQTEEELLEKVLPGAFIGLPISTGTEGSFTEG